MLAETRRAALALIRDPTAAALARALIVTLATLCGAVALLRDAALSVVRVEWSPYSTPPPPGVGDYLYAAACAGAIYLLVRALAAEWGRLARELRTTTTPPAAAEVSA